MVRAWVAILVAVWAFPANAQEQIRFDILLGSIKAGELEIAASEGAGRYALKGRMRSTGLVAAIRKVRYDASTTGRLSGGRYVPSQYSEVTHSGKAQNSAEMAYRSGVPQVKVYTPPRAPEPTDVDPSTQGGSLDPLTALYAVLRAVPENAACAAQFRTFDGKRVAQMQVSKASASADQIVCNGVYRRIAGYDAEELAERRQFPFTLYYTPGENGLWRVSRMELQTLYGKARMIRK